MSDPVRIAVVGAGSVSDMYLGSMADFPDVRVILVSDRHPERAQGQAEKYGVTRHGSLAEALADESVEVVLNLTPPASHVDVSIAALEAGKHVYTEKPLASDLTGGRRIMATAEATGLLVGSAPDITLGSEFQYALRLLRDGAIGNPVFARCEAVLAGPEIWHPRPQFLYAAGGGPLFDIGPYYLTALVAALGPVAEVVGRGTRRSPTRVIGSGPLAGQIFPVEVPSLTTALLTFKSGITAQLLLTFDSASHRGGLMEVFGTGGTLRTPDPNGGYPESALLPAGDATWQDLPVSEVPIRIGRGVVNFARHIRGDEPLIVDGHRALHVLEVMSAIETSSIDGRLVRVDSTFHESAVLAEDWDPSRLQPSPLPHH